MSFVRAVPELLGTSARQLAGIGSMLSTSNAVAAAPTVAVSAAAGDQVSAAVAAFFNGHGQGYQKISAQAADFHGQFVQSLNAGANTYALAEAGNASPLQQQLNAVNNPINAVDGGASSSGNSTPGGGANAGAGSWNGAKQKAGNSRAGGLLSTSVASGTSSTGPYDAAGNDRASGPWIGNGGVIRAGGSVAKIGNITLGGPGSAAGLLGTVGKLSSHHGNSGSEKSAALLLRTVDDNAGTESVGGAGRVNKVAQGKAGWLVASRGVGGAGGLLHRLVSISALRVRPGLGGHGGLSSDAGGAGGNASCEASGGAGGSADFLRGSSGFRSANSFFVGGGAGGSTNLFGLGAGLRPPTRCDGSTSDQVAME
jgi:PE family